MTNGLIRYLYLMDISIIIPTLNEVNYIGQTVDRLLANQSGKLELELIVVDAGSQDETVNAIKERTTQLVVDSTLAGAKYKSLNKGAKLAKGKMLLFLDADTLLPLHFDVRIQEALNKEGVVGGAFEFGFNRTGVVYRIIEWINRTRYRIDKRYFGDQALFCTRENFEAGTRLSTRANYGSRLFLQGPERYWEIDSHQIAYPHLSA